MHRNVCVCIGKSNILQLSFDLDMMLVKSVSFFMLERGIRYFRVNYADAKHVFPLSQGFESAIINKEVAWCKYWIDYFLEMQM